MRIARPSPGWLLGLILVGCGPDVDPASLPDARQTLMRVGKRLGSTLTPENLERIGGDESTVVRSLTASERRSLGRAYLRFRLDRPAIVDVAVPGDRPPFWLDDQGFRPSGTVVDHPDGPFRLWSKRFPAGTIGLGVNALDRRPRGHYAVFVRGEAGTARVEMIGGEADVSDVGPDSGPYLDDARPFRQIPGPLRDAQLIRTRLDARHATALVRHKVWKTRVPSGPAPDQVVVSLGADPARGLAWTWRTDATVADSTIEIVRDDATGPPRVVAARSEPETSDGLLNDPIVRRHRATIDGLDPATAYRYRVVAGGRTSAWMSVRTPPMPGVDYAFLAMGDPQCGLEDWGKLLHKARERRPDAGFLLIAGDLVDRGNERSNWDHFFFRAAGVFEGLPVMPAVGNHEYLDRGPMIFKSAFALPTNGPPEIPHGLTYSFAYSDCFVAVLDSNPAVYSRDKADRIARWLDAELSRTTARWKVVMFHHPITTTHPTRDVPNLAESWVPVLDRHGVDLVIQGHDHAYMRTYPMRGGEVAEGGTVYTVSVSGQKFVPRADRPYAARGFAEVATYQTIDISPRRGTMLYRAYDLEGRELDRFERSKPTQPIADSRSSSAGAFSRTTIAK